MHVSLLRQIVTVWCSLFCKESACFRAFTILPEVYMYVSSGILHVLMWWKMIYFLDLCWSACAWHSPCVRCWPCHAQWWQFYIMSNNRGLRDSRTDGHLGFLHYAEGSLTIVSIWNLSGCLIAALPEVAWLVASVHVAGFCCRNILVPPGISWLRI